MVVEVVHPGLPCSPKKDLTAKLATMYKTSAENIVLFGFRTIFGGGKTSGFALIYDSFEAVKMFEPKYRLARSKLIEVKKTGRKLIKEKKNKAKKLRGTAKTKPVAKK